MPAYRRAVSRLCAAVTLTLLVALGLAALSGPARVTARGEQALLFVPLVARFHTPPVWWTGTTDAAKPVMFHVSPDGAEWSDYQLTIKYFAPGCNVRGVLDMSAAGPGTIADGQFSYDDTMLAFSGTFDSATEAHGTYSIRGVPVAISLPSPPYVCYASVSVSGTWTASRP
ncbi:MAG: hypothetical protein BWY10_00827 [Chloroflexi bacterium ADurb.Bin180]|nr:MAG: hypothetical protein BWY10_00827 [Chloroflexi bacterium ADurb.Bin180]